MKSSASIEPGVSTVLVPQNKWFSRPLYHLMTDMKLLGYTVPRGFITDGASIPQELALAGGITAIAGAFVAYSGNELGLALSLLGGLTCALVAYLPANGRYFKAAVLHDYLLTQEDRRKVADKVFYNAMIHLGVSKLQARIMYGAVRGYSLTKNFLSKFKKKK